MERKDFVKAVEDVGRACRELHDYVILHSKDFSDYDSMVFMELNRWAMTAYGSMCVPKAKR